MILLDVLSHQHEKSSEGMEAVIVAAIREAEQRGMEEAARICHELAFRPGLSSHRIASAYDAERAVRVRIAKVREE